MSSVSFAGLQVLAIIGLAVVLIGGTELAVRIFDVPAYVFPAPSAVIAALISSFDTLLPHILVTLRELITGYIIGALIGIVLAAVITQFPFVEKVITPYILLLITTPMLALVPLLMLKFGFGLTPRIIAVTLAVGPMVMINASTGFRGTDSAKIALARSYGASTLQIFRKIRFPMALPMIIVGLMVGGIFGLITAIGAEMAGGGTGLGTRLVYFSSLGRMDSFFAVIIIVAAIGISLYALAYLMNKRWANWKR
ncbi:MAG: ABC transporter permease subunit [Trueperaceae bacterium]